jgi:SEC-C motif-containing protein
MSRCPCGLPAPYDACCGRFHAGAAAPTAEPLMRSRYTAFAVGDATYLLHTWHPTTRPSRVATGSGWLRLEVLESSGGLLDVEGEVRFRAHAREGVVEERSRFVRERGRWMYVGPARGQPVARPFRTG